MSTGEQIVGAQLVEAAQAHAQFQGDGFGQEQTGAGLVEEVTDEWSAKTMGELMFFMARRVAGRWIFRIGTDTGRRASPPRQSRGGPAVCQASGGAQVASPQSPILR